MSLRYKVEGYAQTRDAIVWVMLSAPNFKYGLTLAEVFSGLEHGYQSVRSKLTDAERIAQWEASLRKLEAAHELFKIGDVRRGTHTLQEAQELFTTLRRIKGRTPTRQDLGETEHGGNELDEE
jgi:hypothetical protein